MVNIEQFLNNAARHYYAGDPIISDEQFDRLADSIGYNAVGAKQHENVAKHYNRLYSLQKFYEDEGTNPLEGYKNIDYTPKVDGAALSLLYIEGQLSQVLTRGDGIEGRICTDKFLATNLVPHTIELTGIVQVTGELCAPLHIENSRNYASGSLGLKDIEEFKTRAVSFFAYGVYPYQAALYNEDMKVLERNGFETVYAKGITDVFPTDGIVFRLNNNAEFEALGYTSKHPRGAYARKVRAAHVETTLLDVVWQTGKSGKVTPVAILEPVMIGDAMVSRATLNNGAYIEALQLYIGCRVAIVRAGEIIPQVLFRVEA